MSFGFKVSEILASVESFMFIIEVVTELAFQ
jgi:hypothetical protein